MSKGYNVPGYTQDNIDVGGALIYVGLAGNTPTTELGALRPGSNIAITREVIEVKLGTPRWLVDEAVIDETVVLSCTGLEFDTGTFSAVLGGADYSEAAGEDVLEIGGSIETTDYAVKLVHQTKAGHTVEAYLWKAKGSNSLTLPFSEEWHEYEFGFKAIAAETNWGSEALATGKRLFKLRRVK